jgi:bacteriorhodopsin
LFLFVFDFLGNQCIYYIRFLDLHLTLPILVMIAGLAAAASFAYTMFLAACAWITIITCKQIKQYKFVLKFDHISNEFN